MDEDDELDTHEGQGSTRRTHRPVSVAREIDVRLVDERGGIEAQAKSAGTIRVGSADGNDIVVRDPAVSRFHLEISRVPEGIQVTDLGSTNGTTLTGGAFLRRSSIVLAAGAVVSIGASRIQVGNGSTVVEAVGDSDCGEMRGKSAAAQRMFREVERLAQSSANVAVLGESGTGKELIARALHELGPRARGPFVVVDCGATAPSLFSSELFGHERGAFTGAERRHRGALERASGGTLFLDEIAELPRDLQPMLLGALERRRFRRVGGTEDVSVDIRVVCATHRDLLARVNEGSFRLDLYYRLAVATIHVPPLRARRGDIALLVEHFLAEANEEHRMAELFPPEVIAGLEERSWPGNLRELRNVVEVVRTLGAPPPTLAVQSVAESADQIQTPLPEDMLELPYRDAKQLWTRRFDVGYVSALLARANGSVRAAARLGRMDRGYLMDLISRHGLSAKGDQG